MRLSFSLVVLATPMVVTADEPWRVRPVGQASDDQRLAAPRTKDSYFPLVPPKTPGEWAIRRREIREQILVATGLWPLPEKTPLQPVIHGMIDRDDYTIEKVYFASMPGHYVCGNLYRPKGKRGLNEGKRPGVLFAHGHWENGRLHDAGEARAKRDVAAKGEGTIESGRYPLQALPAMLARLGCVVFVYDMVGVGDSGPIPHGGGFRDVQAELRLQNAMGLQTWNSLRALDFLAALPDVDPQRLGMTGASGGGTQTFILCAIDDRPAVAFPAVMVSTGMQGGCVCENCSYLRIGVGNVDFAAVFAPKPLGMTAAKDWTQEIEKKGLPELKSLYTMLGRGDHVLAKSFLQFDHNYNQVSREVMYDWMNQHLRLGHAGPIKEKPFVPVPPRELSVFDREHPRPKDSLPAEKLRAVMTESSDQRLERLFPSDEAKLSDLRNVLVPALRTMVGTYPGKGQIVVHQGPTPSKINGYSVHKAIFGHKGEGDRIPSIGFIPPGAGGTIALWIHPRGKESLFENGDLIVPVKELLAKKISVMAPEILQTGEQTGAVRAVDKGFAGYTLGYNRPLLAEQVRDIVAAVGLAKNVIGAEKVHLIGWGSAGPAVVLAKAVCGPAVERTAADLDQFRFDAISSTQDPRLLPGAVKYGGLPGLACLCAPGELYLHHHAGTSSGKWTKAAYQAANAADKLTREPKQASAADVIKWVTR